jgi:uncharacterized protein YoxC
MNKLNEITTNLKQTDPTIKKLSDDMGIIKTFIEKQTTTPDDILSKINELTQKQKEPKDIHSKVEPLKQASKDVVAFFFLQYFSLNNFFYFSHSI